MSACASGASYLRWWLPKVLFVLAALLPGGHGCPKSCACYVPNEVHCTFRYLTAIPDQIQTAVERINLGYNSITALRENDLAGLERLELLMLHSNTISTIENGAFRDLASLQVLKMSYNQVKEIKTETFKGLESLLRLHMDHNRIEFISPEAFYGLTRLQLVHLEGNLLQQLHPDTFVTLRHSKVFKVSSVRNIHLSDNLLTSLPADIFSGCSQLENLYLHGNPWSCDCHMKWFPLWVQRCTGVLKCKRDRKYARGQVCPVCESPAPYRNRSLTHLTADAFTCTKPWIYPHLKQKNISLDEGEFTPVSPRDFIAPIGSMEMNLTDHFHNDASLSCTVQRPSAMKNLTLTSEEVGEHNVTMLTVTVATSLVCNIDYEHIQQLWHILATYSDSPMRLERGLMLARSPEMVYRYSQIRSEEGQEDIYTNIEAEIKASPAWLMQGAVSFQLDRTTTTFSTLHIKYRSVVNLRVENRAPRKDHYTWTMIKVDNHTKTEHTVITGGIVELNCKTLGDPKPSVEWILADGNKVRAPYVSEDRRITITAEGKLTIRGAETSDTGLYRCIATNYLDADLLRYRVTVLSPDVEEAEVTGVQLTRSQGQNLVLDCGATGNPETSVQWILPDHSVLVKSQGNRVVYKNGTLLIQGLTARDRGFYRCLTANHLGIDLLVSQVTVTGEGLESVTMEDNEGSTIRAEVKLDTNLVEKEGPIIEILSSSSSERNSQESRTKTSDRPYPRFRPLRRGVSGVRMGQKRRGPISSSRIWSNRRSFDRANRKVDPQKFAEIMKKAQDGSKLSTSNKMYEGSDTGLSGDGEIGSGEGHNEIQLILLPEIVRATSENPEEKILPQSNHVTVKSTVTQSPAKGSDSQNSAVIPHESVSDSSVRPTVSESNEHNDQDRTMKPLSNRHPVTLRLTVTDTSEETQVQFSGEPHAEPETSTRGMLSFVTDPNVTPMMDGPGPVEPIVHVSTDPDSQTTFTAVTTTERDQDEITFHTTQRIKSRRLPAGSTIISRQQIHILPPKKGRGGGRRRTLHGRRRIIKPNRITDIQSFINKFKQPTLKKEGNATVPYTVELTTDCDCDEDGKKKTSDVQTVTSTTSPTPSSHGTEKLVSKQDNTATTTTLYYITSKPPSTNTHSRSDVSSGYFTSADAPVFEPTPDPYMTKIEEPTTSIPTTAITSKVIRGRVPWNRLFRGKGRQREIINRRNKPSTTTQTPTTVGTIMTIPTTTAALPTAESLPGLETGSPPRQSENTESSSDDDYGDFSSFETQPTTPQPRSDHQVTTTPSYYHSTSTTPTATQTIVSPPTVRSSLRIDPDESSSSGFGGYPRRRFGIRQRHDGQLGRRRWPFRGRRPLRKPTVTEAPTTTTEDMTSSETDMGTIFETTIETTTLPQWMVSVSSPLYTPSMETDMSAVTDSTEQNSEEDNDSDGEDNWNESTSYHLQAYTTNRPWTTSNPTTTFRPYTTQRPHTTPQSRGHNNIRPPIGGNSGHPTKIPMNSRIRPTESSGESRSSPEKTLTFDTMTVLTAEQGYTNTPAPYNNKDIGNAISTANDLITGYEATTANIVGFLPSTKDMPSKPKIMGGNAASFTVLSNSDAYLPCEAVGNPLPTISWRRFSSSTGSTITIKGKMGKFEVFNNGTLSIKNANIKDRGQYVCLAENDKGSDKLLVTLSVVAYPSRILEPKMREIKSHVGNTVEMKCKAEGRPTPLITWILANRTQVRGHKQDKGRVSVNTEGTLIIGQVTISDRGHYKCIASNPAGADTATVRLQVVAAPPGILEEKRQQMKAGVSENLWLPCTGQGHPQPTIHWVLNDGSVVRTDKPAVNPRVSVNENGTLHLKNVTPVDNGKYECIATSSTGSERRVVTLMVNKQESMPQIVETSERLTELSFGDQLKLNCSATGDPKPRIIWRLPSKALVDQWHRMGSRIKVLENGTLIINSVSDKDSGDYLCVARSNIGDDLQLMKVFVSMKPAKIEAKLYGKKHVPYGNDLKVDCKASGAPEPEISWGLPDGTVVNSALQSDGSSGGGRTRRYILFDNGTLYLNQVSMSEEGDYTCYAENQVGKDEMHVHITVVTAAPRIRPPSLTYAKVKRGGNIRFDCEAVGEPKPKILWMLPTNDIIAASNERYLMHVNGSLDIRDVKLVDIGEYVCMARNPAGENSKVYKLAIDGNPPMINGYHQNRTVVKDTAMKYTRKFIDCKAEGDPAPKVTWIMPDNIFLTAPYFGSRINVHHNGTLEIRNARPTDTAEFICMARNDGGEAVMVVQLEVTDMLQRPIFKNPFNERIVTQMGKTTVLNCSVDGYPQPEIIWTLPNGTRFTNGPDRGSHHHVGKDGTFVIYNPSKEDVGKYRCAAKNSMGYIEKIIVLEVGQKPYILTRPKGIIRSMSGHPLFLHCLADGSPRPNIYWTVPGGRTLTRPQVVGRYQLLENGTIVIQDTTLHDRGNYICRARNDAGEAILTVPVIIIAYPPRITAGPPRSVRILAGTPIQLNCAAIGIPKPEISWELPDRSVLSTAGQGRPMGSELLHPQGTLIIQRPTATESGTYKCLAKNHLGVDSKVTYVHVL
ncbi:immunoglobulin superfamily member 10 [Lampris incognitus]|uniref:immunoglobulin superfamily member 10 n=1 Tax=Lampris incognitus TaxID=2546036 RepID=UPI0024B56CF7|nr:immunoglobulin superfamily member 10 [Lampris incognitus]